MLVIAEETSGSSVLRPVGEKPCLDCWPTSGSRRNPLAQGMILAIFRTGSVNGAHTGSGWGSSESEAYANGVARKRDPNANVGIDDARNASDNGPPRRDSTERNTRRRKKRREHQCASKGGVTNLRGSGQGVDVHVCTSMVFEFAEHAAWSMAHTNAPRCHSLRLVRCSRVIWCILRHK